MQMQEIKLGAVIRQAPTIYGFGSGEEERITHGTVVYIHPDRRYYVLEFETLLGNRFRECFWFWQMPAAKPMETMHPLVPGGRGSLKRQKKGK